MNLKAGMTEQAERKQVVVGSSYDRTFFQGHYTREISRQEHGVATGDTTPRLGSQLPLLPPLAVLLPRDAFSRNDTIPVRRRSRQRTIMQERGRPDNDKRPRGNTFAAFAARPYVDGVMERIGAGGRVIAASGRRPRAS